MLRPSTRLLPLLALVASCDETSSLPSNADEAVATVAAIAHAEYDDAHQRAQALADAVDAFVAAPSQSTLDAARAAWLAARIPYLQTETLRGSDGPVEEVEGFLNAWPLDEAHVDYVRSPTDEVLLVGMVNDPSFTVDRASILDANENPGEADVSVGFHAIEFLLWGQDRSASGPGARPAADYLVGVGATAPNGDRRGQYLHLVSELLVEHLGTVRDGWAEGVEGNYRDRFVSEFGTRASLRRVFQSLYWFSNSELGGDRLAALVTFDQEDEHSCFSDNTRVDMVEDARGVRNVYLGSYVRIDGSTVSGVGLYDVLHARDAALADTLRDRIATSLALAEALHDPFDQEIDASNVEGRARLQAFADSMSTQRELLLEAAARLGLTPLGVE